MKKLLKSSTSLTLCVALITPGVLPTLAYAQETGIAECGSVDEQEAFPCMVGDGVLIKSKDAFLVYLEAQQINNGVEGRGIAPQASQQADPEQALKDEEAATAKAESAQAAEQEAAEAAKRAEEEAAQEALRAEEEAAEQKEAEAAIAAEQEAAKQAELEKALEDEQAAATAQAEAEAEAAAQAEDAEAKAARKAERQAARRVERQAELEAARKALEEAPAGETTTEEVTTENVRRSDEDFETTATGDAEVKKDDGLSKLEKALLIGLGAAVVGTVLKNGNKVVSNSGDRVVVQDENGDLRVLKDDDALLRRPGDEVQTERFNDGSTRQTLNKPDGSKVITIRGGDGTVLRRISVDAAGNETVLFDDLAEEREVTIRDLPQVQEQSISVQERSEEELRAALMNEQRATQDRSFSLRQVREIGEVRALAPPIELDAVRFASGSAAIAPDQARRLSRVGNTLRELVADDPRTVFLIEGHTDAVGDATYNLALSDRRAETVALALTEYFQVPPENMITQGYGESTLKVQTTAAEEANRRAVVRNITNLLRAASN